MSSETMPPASQLQRIWVTNGGNGSGGWVWHDPRTGRVWWDEGRQGPFNPQTGGAVGSPGTPGAPPGSSTSPGTPGHGAPPSGPTVPWGSVSVRPVQAPAAPVDAKTELEKLKNQTALAPFLTDARAAIARITHGWEYPADETKTRLIAAVTASTELSEPQKNWLLELINIRSGDVSEIYKALDRRYWDSTKTAFNNVATDFIAWLEKKDADLVTLMTKAGRWRQVTTRIAIETIDRIRKSQAIGDKESVVRAVTKYFFVLTPEQRSVLAADVGAMLAQVTRLLGQMSPTDVQYAKAYDTYRVLVALARGAISFVASAAAQQLRQYPPDDPDYGQLFRRLITERTDSATRLRALTEAAVRVQGDQLIVDPAKRQQLLTFIAAQDYNPDGLLSFAAGLRAHPAWADYGERLALALATPDQNGNFVLATTDTSRSDPTQPGHGAIVVARNARTGQISRAQLRAALDAWDQPNGTRGPASHRYVYRRTSGLSDLRPSAPTQPIRVWVNEGGRLLAYNMDAEGRLTPVGHTASTPLVLSFSELAAFGAGGAATTGVGVDQEQRWLQTAVTNIGRSRAITSARAELQRLDGPAAEQGVVVKLSEFATSMPFLKEAKLKRDTFNDSPAEVLELVTKAGSRLEIILPHPRTESPAWAVQHLKIGSPGNWVVNRRTTDTPATPGSPRRQKVEELSPDGTKPRSVTEIEWPPSGEIKSKAREIVHGNDGNPTHEVEYETRIGGTRYRTKPTGGAWGTWQPLTVPFTPGGGRRLVTTTAPTNPGQLAFATNCAGCHTPPSGPGPAELKRRRRTAAAIISFAKAPSPSSGMPPQTLGDATLSQIATWIMTQ